MKVFDDPQTLRNYCKSDLSQTIKVKCVKTYAGYWYKKGEIYEVYDALYNTVGRNHYMLAPFDGTGISVEDAVVISPDIINIAEIDNMFKEI